MYMNNDYAQRIADELKINTKNVSNTIELLEEDATVPFIARYRKERTGGLDEVQIIQIRDRLLSLKELTKRAEAIIKSLKETDQYTEELGKAVANAKTLSALEDIYLPYKPKRKTRASIAREKGLEPLAIMLLNGNYKSIDDSKAFVNKDKGVESSEEALKGASDIIAEMINEDSKVRENLRIHFKRNSELSSRLVKKMEKEGEKYRDYFDW